MTQAEIYSILAEIFDDVFLREVSLRPDLSAKDVDGWDSFKQIDIVMAVEERFGFKAATKDLDALQTVGDLVQLIVTKTA
ncbi:acyl carrier protein [Lichenihabitans sp. PAMC28606]|uniref:acyl carrier protein n=1 Tax=Lichenihabitans sp. PAMC28606 TaxID=2880932 RepID=UPI001D0BA098|nr:acyl carrier protein [Lichenihabitans sp. PAMC28606]UDL93545.1 acyl carrier protein [Lichenihabitans sp. PAMC28606]